MHLIKPCAQTVPQGYLNYTRQPQLFTFINMDNLHPASHLIGKWGAFKYALVGFQLSLKHLPLI